MWHWQFLSRFGETTLLLPCAVMLYAWFRYSREAATARQWLCAFVAAAGLTLLSKLAYMGWGIGVPSLDFTGFSGHSMMAAAVLPVVLHRLVPARPAWLALAAASVGVMMAAGVSVSRLALGVHSLSEVAGGLVLGLGASIWCIALSHGTARRTAPPLAIALMLCLVLGLPASGATAPTHHWLEQIAVYLSHRDKPYDRDTRAKPRHAALTAEPARSFAGTGRSTRAHTHLP
jgi:membrane-associated phospholipid phosphatase